jgi:hypothetical protein
LSGKLNSCGTTKATVRKSRYRRSSAAARTSGGAGGSMIFTRVDSGIEEIT